MAGTQQQQQHTCLGGAVQGVLSANESDGDGQKGWFGICYLLETPLPKRTEPGAGRNQRCAVTVVE